jgi:hypothetical protein
MPTLLPGRRKSSTNEAAQARGLGMPRWWWIVVSIGLIFCSIFIVVWLLPEPCWMKGKTIEFEEFIKVATC